MSKFISLSNLSYFWNKAKTWISEKVATEIAKIVDDAPESFDTLKEIATWLSTHSNDALTMQNDITKNKQDITAINGNIETINSDIDDIQAELETLSGGVGSVDTQITNKINELDSPDQAVEGQMVSEVSQTDGKITVKRVALPDYSNTYDAKGAASTAETNAKQYTDSLNTNTIVPLSEKVTTLETNMPTAYENTELDEMFTELA